VYESNPTLQSSMSIDDYLMQAYRPTTPTTEELATGITTQLPQPAAINPVKPIIPIPESDSGGITTIQPRAPKEPLTFRESMAQLNLQRGVPVNEEEKNIFEKITGSPFVKYNPMNPMFLYNVGKKGLEKAREFARKIEEQKQQERIAEARAKAQARAAIAAADSGYNYDPGGGNYGMGFGPGRTDPTDKS